MKQAAITRDVSGGVSCVLLFLGLYATLGIFLHHFSFPQSGALVLMAALIAAGFLMLALWYRGKRKWLIYLVVWGVLFFIGWLAWDWILYGGYIAAIWVGAFLNVPADGAMLVPILTPVDETACLVFGIFVLLVYIGLLVFAVVVRKSVFLSALFTAPVFVLSYDMTRQPEGPFLALAFTFWLATLLLFRLQKSGKPVGAQLALSSISIVLAIFLILFAVVPPSQYVPSQKVISTRKNVYNTVMDWKYTFRGLFGFYNGTPLTGSDGSADLDATGRIKLSDDEIMRVHADRQYNLYLRGYSAAEYTGHEWAQPESGGWKVSDSNIDPLVFEEKAEWFILLDERKNNIQIEFTGEESNFLFTPYLMYSLQVQDGAVDRVDDAYFSGEGITKYSSLGYGWPELRYSVQGHFANELDYDAAFAYAGAVSDENHPAAPLYQTPEGMEFVGDQSYVAYSMVETTEEIMQQLGGDQLMEWDAILMDQAIDGDYMAYIRENYTQLPDGVKKDLLKWWDSRAENSDWENPVHQRWYERSREYPEGPPSWWWVHLAGAVSEEISSVGRYTTSPGAQPRDRDFVEYFLNESKKGYCVHYASATVAMLRALGVPARYVEGYVVPEASFNKEGYASVKAKNAHAWAEIWVPGIGWTPVESTPGGAAPTPDGVENEAAQQSAEPSADSTEAEQTEPPEPSNRPNLPGGVDAPEVDMGMDEEARHNMRIFAIVALCIAAASAPWIYRQRMRTLRKRNFRLSDQNKAVLYLYAYLEKLERYGTEIPQDIHDIAQKAKFSKKGVTATEYTYVRQRAQDEVQELWATIPKWKKVAFWFKYL